MINFKNMSYVEFISFLQETNRCPGGKDTIHWILKNSFASKDSTILEVGSNTGFSSLEVARLLKCKIYGIDVSQDAVDVANKELEKDISNVKECVKFSKASAYNIPYPNEMFDLIIAGGSTSFMNDKSKAVQEMNRVLKNWAFLSVTNLFYHTEPPKDVIDNVSNIIGVNIKPMSSEDWLALYLKNQSFELYKFEKLKLHERSEEEIDNYVDYFLHKKHILNLSNMEKIELKEKWKDILMIFNENHKYLGFIKALFRKRFISEEPELFKL